MTIKHDLKLLVRRFGLDVGRYNPVESFEARLFRQLQVHTIDTILDIGANDGGYGRALRESGYDGRILSFEPLSEAHAKLQQTAAGDSLWAVAPRQAIGDLDGEIEINISGNSTSSSVLPMHDSHTEAAPQSRYIGSERVRISRLDSIDHPQIREGRSILLKIDTQGYEMPVLHGATNLLSRVVGVQLELSLVPLYQGQALYREIIDWLANRGFSLWSVIPGFTDLSTGRMMQMDGVFFRD